MHGLLEAQGDAFWREKRNTHKAGRGILLFASEVDCNALHGKGAVGVRAEAREGRSTGRMLFSL